MRITRAEEWIAARSMPILFAVVLAVIVGGAVAYLVRVNDLERVETLERTIRCQDSPECRQFIRRIIRELLRDAELRNGQLEVSGGKQGSLRIVPSRGGGLSLVPAPSPPGSGEQPRSVERPSMPSLPPDRQNPQDPGKVGKTRPEQPSGAPKPQPAAPQPEGQALPEESTEPERAQPGNSESRPATPKGPPLELPKVVPPKVREAVEELPCTALREVHELC